MKADWRQGALRHEAVLRAVLGREGADDLARVQFYLAVTGGADDLPVAELAATALDVMALYGLKPAAEVAARLGMVKVRGAARARAVVGAPAALRSPRQPQDVQVSARSEPYARFFAVEEYDLSFRQFGGQASPVVTRAVFLSGDAVTVLPYDPVRDRVLLVEQFRSGPFGRGDANPWQLEAIAGRIDPGETPEQAARREAVEEAGLTLGALETVAGYYPSPGICAEFLYSYVALCDLPDGSAGVFGVAGEAEDIRGHLIGFDDLMALVGSGEVGNAPLILTALWLQRERGRLREK
ncbi:NUDIX domain-containing protein [Fuscibacter oryzae]|uniref:ADP-ribose pyrophosphatase n=1 Tax=Fuscibacter oryzae TaxID=2803939 RepID=A0A8J7STK2_9RHOB|nr:NUDIX domain-containing protein [Fuscibacter oryzae]MBL4927587.1 NUDIX domain-containing protein [Fuscibacter oryzae]